MKSILIFSHNMELGGAEKALLGLLETIDTTKYDVDLFLMRHSGELYKHLPKNINLLPEKKEYASLAVPIQEVLKKRQLRVAVGRLHGKYAAKQRVKKLGLARDNDVALQYSHKYTLSAMPKVSDKEYDLAISFLTPHYFVVEKVRAKKRIAWIHTDYSYVNVDKVEQLEMWKQYDAIVSISDCVTVSFLKKFPELKDKIQVIENIMPINYIHKLAEETLNESEMPEDGSIKLLSIGRFCNAKNFDNIPDICAKIREKGMNTKWYLIGYGSDEQLIKDKIKKAGMEEYVTVLGKKENPYPYIKQCDFYIQPSRYEGKCVSVTEAQILHKPVIITNYATAESQLENGVDGVIVPLDNEGCANAISEIIQDVEFQQRIVENTKKRDYSKKEEVFKIYKRVP